MSGLIVDHPLSDRDSSWQSWYALQVKRRFEKAIASNLRSKGHLDFVPLHTRLRRWSDRVQKIEVPLFPGYVFCRFDVRDRLGILNIPGVISIVSIGKNPQPLDESEMSSLQAVVRSGLLLKPWPFLRVGQRVVIEEGPLRNVEGLLARIPDRDQLIVNVTLLQRAVAVSIHRSWIRPLDQCEDSAGNFKKKSGSEHHPQTLPSRPDYRA